MKPVLVINGQKRCSICKQMKPVDCFGKTSAAKSGLGYGCKKCKEKLRKEIYSKKPHAIRSQLKSWLKNQFGMTLEQYDKLFEQQNSVCKICGGINLDGRRLAVDHDHKTGKIRGLLCANCNLALGYVKENISVLVKMIGYLENGRRGNPNPTAL